MRIVIWMMMFAVLPVTLPAATVLWDYLTNFNVASGRQMTAGYYDNAEGYTEISFSVEGSGRVVADGVQALAWAGIVDRGFVGGVVDSLAFAGDEHFIYQRSNATVHGSDYAFQVEVGNTFYLMFQTSTYTQECNPYFGWALFYVDEGYDVFLVDSAVGLEHQAMVVGGGSAIPEPTGASLLLLGVAMLGLRRRWPRE